MRHRSGAIIVFDIPYDDRTDYRLDEETSSQLALGSADPAVRAAVGKIVPAN